MLEGLDDVPWVQLGHAYGEASDVPGQIRRLISDDVEARQGALWELFGNIYHQGTVYEATAYAVPFLVEIAGESTLGDRSEVLGLIASIAEGSSYLDVHQDLTHPREESRGADFRDQMDRELADVRAAREAVLAGVPTFLRLLGDSDPDVRVAASYLLGRLPERAGVTIGSLKERVEWETDTRARASAILAVGVLLGPEASGMDRDRLAEVMHEEGPELIGLAAGMSAVRMTPGDIPRDVLDRMAFLVGQAREDFATLPWCDGDAVHDIGAILENRPAGRLNFQIGLLSHEYAGVRSDAIWSIEVQCQARRSVPKIAAPALADRLADVDPEIRKRAASVLSRLGHSAMLTTSQLLEALHDPSSEVRIHAAIALAKAGDERAVPALIEGLVPSMESSKVAEALGSLGPKASPAVPTLIRIIETGPTNDGGSRWNRMIQAAITLGRIGESATAAIPTLIESLRRREIMHGACLALIDFGPAARSALHVLGPLLEAGNHNLRAQAAFAYWRVGGYVDRAVASLSSVIREDPRSSSDAIGFLAEIGEPARIALPLLDGALEDQSFLADWSRVRAARAYWQIGRRSDVALPVLLELLARIESLGMPRAKLVVDAFGEMGPIAREVIPTLHKLAGCDERPFGGAVDRIIEEDEAFLDTIKVALARIEGEG